MTDDELMQALGNAPVRFWTCLNRAHKTVTWSGDVAKCDTCGLTSDMTRKRDSLVRDDERRRVAAQIRAIPDDDGPYHTGVRKFIDRHPRLIEGSSIVAVLLAVADEIEGSSAPPEETTNGS